MDDESRVNVRHRKNLTGPADDPDEGYMRGFSYRKHAEEADAEDVEWAADRDGEVLQATRRVARWPQHKNDPEARTYSGTDRGAWVGRGA